jgi:hypothetical protein
MDKVLNRKLFKDRYLQSVSKNIARFKEGGLASLRAKRFLIGGEALFTPGERQAMIAGPIISSLLTGTRRPGQSQLGAVASGVGAGIPGSINTALQIGKVEEEARKKPDFKSVIDTVTGEPKFISPQELALDIQNKTNRYAPPEGNIAQIIRATTATDEAKAVNKRQNLSKDKLVAAADVADLSERLINSIENSSSFTGTLGDVALAYQGVEGSVKQILGADSRTNQYHDENRVAIETELNKQKWFDKNATQQVKSATVDLAYMFAKAREPGGRFSVTDIDLAMKTLGKSSDKDVFIAGIKEATGNVIAPAIRSYTDSFGVSEDKIPDSYKYLVEKRDLYQGRPTTTKGKTDKPVGKIDLSPKSLGIGSNTTTKQ